MKVLSSQPIARAVASEAFELEEEGVAALPLPLLPSRKIEKKPTLPAYDLSLAVAQLKQTPDAPEAKLAAAICACLKDLTPAEIRVHINGHLARMQMLTADVPALDHVDAAQLEEIVWQMAAGARHNEYMHKVLVAAGPLPAIAGGPEVARDVATFAFTLEALTQSVAHDGPAIEKMLALSRSMMGVAAAQGTAYAFKMKIVRDAVEGIANALATGEVAPDAFHRLLQNNINVMTVIDEPANNEAALALSARAAFAADGHQAKDATLQGATVRIAFLADTRDWVNLYSSWNAVLGLQTAVAPFFVTKLLIPSVSNYVNDPGAYMHERAVALYLFMLWHLKPDARDLSMPALAKTMAAQNAKNARVFNQRALSDGFGAGAAQPIVTKMVHWKRSTF